MDNMTIVDEFDKSKIVVRKFDEEKDSVEVAEMERRCEVGPSGKLSLFTDLLGDPICRIRHSPAFLMLVAEVVVMGGGGGGVENDGGRREIVGIVRGCIKTVTCGKKLILSRRENHSHDNTSNSLVPVYTKLAYISGLRVSHSHRRMGVGLELVREMEKWFRDNGAEYSYMATETENIASVNLFTRKCGYSEFRTPSILVQPVFAHRVGVPSEVNIIKLTPSEGETLYRRHFSTTEFFPRDIGAVLTNPLSLGTFLARPAVGSLACSSWAVVSVWNCMDVWRLEVRGASRVTKGLAKTTRLLDRALPWLKIPSVPEVFKPFGFHFLYGVGGEGPEAVKLMRAVCGYAHDLAKERGCAVVATEVAAGDPMRSGIPHWKKLSCAEDLWCIKRLADDYSEGSVGDWTKCPPDTSIFVDPREF